MTRRFRPALEAVESRLTPAFTQPLPAGSALVPAGGGVYRVIEPSNGSDVGTVTPFPDGFAGAVRAATGDVTGDGVPDLVVAAGAGGGPRVRVFDGSTGAVVRDFFAFDPGFRGGVSVAAADVNGDGKADIVVGAGAGGGPRVRVFDGAGNGGTVRADFFAFEAGFRGGVNVAAGDVDADGTPELVAGAGPGGAPRVAVFRPAGGAPLASFLAYDADFRGGVNVTTATSYRPGYGPILAGPYTAMVVTGPGAGGGPDVRVFSGVTGVETASAAVGDPAGRGGVGVTGGGDAVTAAVPGPGGVTLVSEPLGGGAANWTLPPGDTRVGGILAAAPANGSVTLEAAAGNRTIPVRADAAVERAGAPARLSDFAAGDVVTATVGPDGAAVAVEGGPPVVYPFAAGV